MLREASTITDIHNNCDATEVELISLVSEQIPKYQLRAFSVFGYNQRDWLQSPVLAPDTNVDLSPELCEETFKYFILSGDRLSLMTRTYHDIEAVTHLLEEKERDLELAARIGQTLLQKNRDIAQRNEQLEDQLAGALEEVSQLRHEVSLKEDLLHTYADDETDSSGAPSPVKELRNFGRTGMYNHIEGLQVKIKKLEKENARHKLDQVKYQTESEALETQEQKLVSDTVKELTTLREELKEARNNNRVLNEELAQRSEEAIRQQEEITRLLTQIVDMQRKQRQLAFENEELQQHLTAANNTQYELTREIQTLDERYQEVNNILDETREEARLLRDYPEQYGRTVPFSDSLAAELECSGGLPSELQFQDPHFPIFHNCGPINWSSPPSSVIDEENVNDDSCPELHATGRDLMNRIIKSEPRSRSNRGESLSQRVLNTARFVNNIKNFSMNSKFQYATPRKQDRPIPTPLPIPGSNRALRLIDPSPDSTPSSGLATPSLGRPGIPGTDDLERAISKLALRRESARYMEMDRRLAMNENSFGCSNGAISPMPSGGRTPPPSCPGSPKLTKKYRYSAKSSTTPKLRIVKPLEGSVTLNQWKYLAERDRMLTALQLNSEVAPGIITRDRVAEVLSRSKDGSSSNTPATSQSNITLSTDTTPIKSSKNNLGNTDFLTLHLPAATSSPSSQHFSIGEEVLPQGETTKTKSDMQKKETLRLSPICLGKGFALTSSQYTYTNCRVMNPTDEAITTPSCASKVQSTVCCKTYSSSARVTTTRPKDSLGYLSSIHPFLSGQSKKTNKSQQVEVAKKFFEENTRTCSMQLGLARLFREHGVKCSPSTEEDVCEDSELRPLTSSGEKLASTASTVQSHSSDGHVLWNRSLQRTFLLPSSLPNKNILFNLNRRSDSKKPDTPPNSPVTSVPSSASFLLNEILAETSQPNKVEQEKRTDYTFSSNLLTKLAQIGRIGLHGFKTANNSNACVQTSTTTSGSTAHQTVSTSRVHLSRDPMSKSATAPGSLRAKDAVAGASARNFSRLSLDYERPFTTSNIDRSVGVKPAQTDWTELHGSSGSINISKDAKSRRKIKTTDGYLDEVSTSADTRIVPIPKVEKEERKNREGLRLLLDQASVSQAGVMPRQPPRPNNQC